MTNNEMLRMIGESCTVTAPDRFSALSYEAAAQYKNTTPKISARKHYISAAVIYATACIVLLVAIPFIIGGGEVDNPNPAVSGDETTTDETKYDLGGEEFVILCDWASEYALKNDDINDPDIMAEIENHDNSPGYYFSKKKAERYEVAEKKFGINITVEMVEDPAFETVVRDQAGQTVNNAIFAQGHILADAVLEGYIYDLREIDTIDLTKSYWLPSTVESLTVADRLFLASGMLTFDPIANSDFVVFNNDLINELKLDSPYELVKSDSWTYDVLIDMILAAEKDLDGDGEIGMKDRHGGFSGGDLLNKMWQAPLCEKNTDNTYTYSPHSESGILGYSKYKSRLDNISYAFEDYESMGNSLWDFEYWDNVLHESFREGRSLFVSNEFVGSYYGGSENSLMNRLSDNAGVVPYPTVSDEYEYYTEMNRNAGLLAVPSGVADPEMTGRILDYLASASEEMLYNEYFDWCLKNEENGQNNVDMFKVILDSTVYDWANLYIPAEFSDFREKTLVSGSFSSVLNRYAVKIQQSIDEAVEKIKNVTYGTISTNEEDVVFGYRDLFMSTSEYAPDAEKKNAYAKEYMYNIAKSGEITLMPELAVTLESTALRLLAVSFTAFEEDEALFVETDKLRYALVGDKEYTVPPFANRLGYIDYLPENEIVIYMTADEFREIQPPEGMKVVAGLAKFPNKSSISSLLTTLGSDDTVMTHLYIDLYDYMTYDDALTSETEDEWEMFKYKVERYYDREIPQEYRDMLSSGAILESLKKTAGGYCSIGDFSIIPELCKIQMRIDKSALSKLDNQHYDTRNHYILKAR